MEPLYPAMDAVLKDMEAGKLVGSTRIAIAVLEALKDVTINSKAQSSDTLLKELRGAFLKFLWRQPQPCILPCNGFRYLIHEVERGVASNLSIEELKKLTVTSIDNFIKSMKVSVDKIGEIGARYISDNDVIMTAEASTSVLSALAKAYEAGKKFQVVVTETRPEYHGRLMAMALADIGIPTTLIIDSAHRCYMRKVTRVFLGSRAVLPTGEVLAKVGSAAIAAAAYEAGVPVLILTNTHKFVVEASLAEEALNSEGDPSLVFPASEAERLRIKVVNPEYDVIPARYIYLIITERGVIPPQGAIVLVRELYGWPLVSFKPEDLW